MKQKIIYKFTIFFLSFFFASIVRADFRSTSAKYDGGQYVVAAKEFQKLAQNGDSEAQFFLGNLYLIGIGVDKNSNKAFSLFKTAAENGNAGAQHAIAYCYLIGSFACESAVGATKPDMAKAHALETLAAEAGQADAIYALARYFHGKFDNKKWLLQSADSGSNSAQWKLSQNYHHGSDGFEKDSAKSLIWLMKSAENGNELSQSDLGERYFRGEGVTTDIIVGRKLLEQSAAKGNREYIKRLINITYNYDFPAIEESGRRGARVEQYVAALNIFDSNGNTAEAVDWLHKSAAQNYAPAASQLGSIYFSGYRLPADYKLAYKFLLIGASNGDSRSQDLISTLYKFGLGVKKDYSQEIYWMKKSIINGDNQFIEKLVEYTKKDRNIIKGAIRGDAESEYFLGIIYLNGWSFDMPIQRQLGRYWIKKSADQGFKVAEEKLKAMAND